MTTMLVNRKPWQMLKSWFAPIFVFRVAVAALSFLPGITFGLGSRVPNQDPEAIGRANAFAATADNPSALYYNPAGITQLDGQNVQIGCLLYMNIYADYDSPSGQRFENKRKFIP